MEWSIVEWSIGAGSAVSCAYAGAASRQRARDERAIVTVFMGIFLLGSEPDDPVRKQFFCFNGVAKLDHLDALEEPYQGSGRDG